MAKQIECTYEGCRFEVRSGDEEEAVAMAQLHLAEKHGEMFSMEDIRDAIVVVK